MTTAELVSVIVVAYLLLIVLVSMIGAGQRHVQRKRECAEQRSNYQDLKGPPND
jgi:hypothetical protein